MVYRLALVTGATSGIGRAICELLARKGIDLIISGRNLDQLQYLQNSLSQKVNVQAVQADLARPEERQHLIDVLHDRVPDLVINNAGFGLYGQVLTYPTQEQLNILEVNGKAVLEITIEAARTLATMKKKGVILNVSSAAAFQILPSMAVYAASKALINHFSQALDFEVKRHGIRVLTICPGMVATEFQKRAGGKVDSQQIGFITAPFVAEQIWKQIERLNPLSIIDWKYRFLTFLSYFVPKSWIAANQENIIEKRIDPRTLIKTKI